MEKKWLPDMESVKVETIRFCPKCSKQAYHVKLNRDGIILFAECVLCGYKK